ncbi:MAG: hypothetical protein JST12_16530 [Armatimonadetes bacterium]|nr:hypothetical protein [Armatimonadota bacterium]
MDIPTPRIGLPYQEIWNACRGLSFEKRLAQLKAELDEAWVWLYEQSVPDLGRYELAEFGSASYLHDTRSDDEDELESRVVYACALSEPNPNAREPFGMRAPLCCREFGQTKDEFPFDRGHFIAHSLGGFDQIGLYPQRRDVNRGVGDLGRKYVAMERYARRHAGTFLFCRPIYGDNTVHPFWIEFGVLKENGEFWVEVFPNRYTFEPFVGLESVPQWVQDEAIKSAERQRKSEERFKRKMERERKKAPSK